MSGRLGNKAFSNIKLHKNEDNLIMIQLANGDFAPLLEKDQSTGKYFFNAAFVDKGLFNGTSPSIEIDDKLKANSDGSVEITVTIGGIVFEQISQVICYVGEENAGNATSSPAGENDNLEYIFTFTPGGTNRVQSNTEILQLVGAELSKIKVELKYKEYVDDVLDDVNVLTITGLNEVVIDNVPPEINLIGDNPYTHERGNVFTDPGATVTDNTDVDLSGSIISGKGTVDENIVGSYTLSYEVTDTAGNIATPVTRTVNVVDSILPVLELLGDPVDFILRGQTYIDAGVNQKNDTNGTNYDLTIDPPTTSGTSESTLDTATETGLKTIKYTATEDSKPSVLNETQVTREVNVFDKKPPTDATLSKTTANQNESVELSWKSPSHIPKVFESVVDGYILEIITIKEVSFQTTAVGDKYVIDGVPQKTLDVEKGRVYTFKYPSNHPLRFSTDNNNIIPYTTNVSPEIHVEDENEVTIRIPNDTPPTLYYYCTEHSEMGGKINIDEQNFNFNRLIDKNKTIEIINASQLPEENASYSIELYTLYSDGPTERKPDEGYLGTHPNNKSESAVALLDIKITVTVSSGAVSLEVGPSRVMNSVSNERTVNVYANLNKEYNNVSGLEGSETWSTGTILNSIDFNLTCAASNIVNITKAFNGIDAIAFGAVTDETDVCFVKCSGLNVGTGSLDHVKICTVTVKDVTSLGVNNVIFANGNELWDTKEDPNVSIIDFEITGEVDLN